MKDICRTFQGLAQQTWDTLAVSRLVAYPMQEETFTDLHLLYLKLHHPEVKIVSFTKPQEGVNGADWEWWFRLADGNWVGYRVQAKVLDVRSERFEQLYYRKDKSSVSQCDKLIAAAKADKKYPCIPIYALYLHSTAHPKTIDARYGCSTVSAYRIRAAKGVKSTALADWHKTIRPSHELVCPNVAKEPADEFRVEGPPAYILQGFNNETDYVVADNNPHNLAGALVIDLRQ